MSNAKLEPKFQYHISGILEAFTEESPLYNLPILGQNSGGILIHEYFELAKKFIQSNNYHVLKKGLLFILNIRHSIDSSNLSQNINASQNQIDITYIDIFLEKHGAFYHPARVDVTIKQKPNSIPFVLNTAVSLPGLSLIHNEYNILKYLNKQGSDRNDSINKQSLFEPSSNELSVNKTNLNELDKNLFLPKVFGVETMICRGMKIAFLLGMWFDGYKEFHLTNNKYMLKSDKYQQNNKFLTKDISNAIHLWNGDGSVIPIFPPDYFEIYEKASAILTHFYNLKTFQHIFPWHHAAGDFVAKQTVAGFDVKLITVRGYDAIVESASQVTNKEINNDETNNDDELRYYNNNENAKNNKDIYKALLLFFLNLTLYMRIDRIDGIGDYCLVDEEVMPFILRGFFRTLEKKDISITDEFRTYLIQFSYENLYRIFLVMISDYDPDNPETLFIQQNLNSHSKLLWNNIVNAN